MVIMIDLHPQFVSDSNGIRTGVLLPVDEYDRLLDELEMQADVAAYDRAKAEGGPSMPFEAFVASLDQR